MAFSVVFPFSAEIVVSMFGGKRCFVYQLINNSEKIIFAIFSRLCNFFEIGLELGSLDYCPQAASQSLDICSTVVGSVSSRSADSMALIVTEFGVFTENGSSFCTII